MSIVLSRPQREPPPKWSSSGSRRRLGGSSRIGHLLLEDTDLFDLVPRDLRDQALQDCLAEIITLAPGNWPAEDASSQLRDGLGLLILDGLVVSRVGIEGRFGAELLGSGDLLRPWQDAADALALQLSTSRKVLAPTRVAVLDMAFAGRAAAYPQIAAHLVARTMNRSLNLAVLMAIAHHPRADVRLHSLFWHLAGRWGRKRADGVLVPLRLTHSVLADLIAARRPTVSSALADLSRRGVLAATAEGWHLSGEPPRELYDLPVVAATGCGS
jgi:CRP/FNR family cyclic AMP-dependent transcriptional regulator